ncbi:MAG: aminotransferase class I/II-fold pyridoxal phosphate-dependent enzyme [Thermoanaerobaculia bacterium]
MADERLTSHLAERTSLLGFSDIVKIRNRVIELRGRGVDVLQFQGGEPFGPTPELVKDAMRRALDENQTRYAPSSGIPSLLEAIEEKVATRNGIPLGRKNAIVVAGGMHGLFCAFQAAVDSGDEVMFFSPYWTPIQSLVNYCGAKQLLVPWEAIREEDPAEVIRRHVTSATRVLYLNSPSNPTGDVLSRPQLESIARAAVEHDLVVIADEAYEDLIYDGRHVSIASLPGMLDRTITCFTLSKSYSMTGWRVGYVVASDLWMDSLKKLVLNSVNGVSTPTQFAAAAAIADRSDYLEKNLEHYRERRDLLVAGLIRAGFRCVPPAGAIYLFLDVRERLGEDSWTAFDTLLDRTNIATVPGVVFGPHGEGHLRMSFSTSTQTIERAIDALSKMK